MDLKPTFTPLLMAAILTVMTVLLRAVVKVLLCFPRVFNKNFSETQLHLQTLIQTLSVLSLNASMV